MNRRSFLSFLAGLPVAGRWFQIRPARCYTNWKTFEFYRCGRHYGKASCGPGFHRTPQEAVLCGNHVRTPLDECGFADSASTATQMKPRCDCEISVIYSDGPDEYVCKKCGEKWHYVTVNVSTKIV